MPFWYIYFGFIGWFSASINFRLVFRLMYYTGIRIGVPLRLLASAMLVGSNDGVVLSTEVGWVDHKSGSAHS